MTTDGPDGSLERAILHADLDAFYASVEQLDDPELRGKPVIVGGSPEGRGVVAAASYEARRFGIRSAMPMSRAVRLCPEAVRVSPRFERYGELSRQVMAIFRSVTPLVEPISLDEAFLDATGVVGEYGGTESLGRGLKQRVREDTGLIVSIGAGTNKTVAKIASDMGKPDGLVVVAAGDERAFLAPLPVRSLWGVGPKAEARLRGAGIMTIGELADAEPAVVGRLLGSRGPELQAMARGEDNHSVQTEHERKSVGAERTFSEDLHDGPELRERLAQIAAEVARRLTAHGSMARTIAIKLRYSNFHTITRQLSQPDPTDDEQTIRETAEALLSKVARPDDRFRLLGIHCAGLVDTGQRIQLSLWSAAH